MSDDVVDDSDGCGAKFSVLIVSPKFAGVSLLQRQRMVNETLKVEMEKIHALSQKCLTPEQWAGQQANASAPGKVILFGEHSVVYGKNAVAATLGRRTSVSITPRCQSKTISLNLPAVGLPDVTISLPDTDPSSRIVSLESSMFNIPEITENATPQLLARLSWWAEIIKKHATISKAAEQSLSVLGYLHSELTPTLQFCRGLQISVASELKPGAGTGSSAAYAVAMAATFAQLSDSNVNTSTIEQLAWKAEHFVHGKPSGLDTAISSQGGILKFSRSSTGFSFMPAPIPSWSLRILLVDSGVERNTRHMVDKAKLRLDEIQQDTSQSLLNTMDHLALTAVSALQEEQVVGYSRLESLVQVNQGLLYALGVSHPSLDAICATAARHGLHAKLTGAGGGGNAFVLLPPDLEQPKLLELQEELKSQGFFSSEETLFGPGVTTMS